MGGGRAVLGPADSGEPAGDGVQRGIQHRKSVCEQPGDGLEQTGCGKAGGLEDEGHSEDSG